MRFDYHPLKPLRVLGAALFVATAVAPVLVPAEAVQAQKNAGDGGVQQGETVINAKKQQLWPPVQKPAAKPAFKKSAPRATTLRQIKPPKFKPPSA